MSYPILPMAIVTFLAGISKQRAELPRTQRNITVLAHHDKTVNSIRLAVEDDSQWGQVVQGAVTLFNQGDVDTMAIIYPADGEDPVDFGVIMEGGRKPSFFQWGYDPVFDIRLAPTNVIEQISQGVGVDTIQGLLDRDARTRGGHALPTPGSPLVNDAYKLAGSGSGRN